MTAPGRLDGGRSIAGEATKTYAKVTARETSPQRNAADGAPPPPR